MIRSISRLPRFCLSLLALLVAGPLAPATPAQKPPASPADSSAMAHSVLRAGLQANGIVTDTPWHLKAEFHLLQPPPVHPLDGALEEWFAAPGRWRRNWSSGEAGMSGTEWSTSPTQRLLARRGADTLDRIRLNMRIADPLTDPLARASLIPPDAPLELKIIRTGDLTLNCISVPRQPNDTTPPYPSMCFDLANHLRLLSTLSAAFEFDKFEVFQKRAVARSLKVLVRGAVLAEIEITSLEPLPDSDKPLLDPPAKAVREPILLQPGQPAPVSVSETGAHPPLQPDGYPYRGAALLLLVVAKDGRATIDRGLSITPGTDVLDSLEIAVHRWKFNPYLVDGQPADVELVARYPLDGKPFQPLFAQPHTIDLSELEAYLEAGGSEGFAGGAPRTGGGGRRH